MTTIQKIKVKNLLYTITVLVMIWVAFTPTTAYAASQLNLTAEQLFTTSSPQADSTFTYKLQALDLGNTMPAGSTGTEYTFTIAGNASKTINFLSNNQPGVYRYRLLQVIGTTKPNYTYDKRIYTIEVHVKNSLSAEIVIINEDGSKAANIRFTNTYAALPTKPSLMVDPPVKKTVSGNPSHNGTFVFKLSPGSSLSRPDLSQPMPAGSVNGVKTITIVGEGQSEFGTWCYDKAGVYFYTICEVNTGESGYTYDNALYHITDTVQDTNGQLVLSRVVTNDINKQVRNCTFVNIYSGGANIIPPAQPVSPVAPPGYPPAVTPVRPTEPSGPTDPQDPNSNIGPDNPAKGNWNNNNMPKTGDDSNTTLYLILLALGAALIISGTTTLIRGDTAKRQ